MPVPREICFFLHQRNKEKEKQSVEEQTVYQIEDSADSRNCGTGIFYSAIPFDTGFCQIPGCSGNEHEDPKHNREPNSEGKSGKCIMIHENSKDYRKNQSAGCSFPGFFRADLRNHLMIAVFHQFIADRTRNICPDISDLCSKNEKQKQFPSFKIDHGHCNKSGDKQEHDSVTV